MTIIQILTLKYIDWGERNVHNSIATEEKFQKYGEKQIYINIIEKKLVLLQLPQVCLPFLWEIYLALARSIGREKKIASNVYARHC